MATIVLFAIARSRLGSPLGRITLLLLCGGLLAAAVSDSGFSYLALQNTYASGNRIDVGWFLGYLLVFLAARQAPRHAAAWMEPPLSGQSAASSTPQWVWPPAPPPGALMWSAVDPFVFWVGLFLVAASIARHVLIAADRRALEQSVEAWVPAVRKDTLADWGAARRERRSAELETLVRLQQAVGRGEGGGGLDRLLVDGRQVVGGGGRVGPERRVAQRADDRPGIDGRRTLRSVGGPSAGRPQKSAPPVRRRFPAAAEDRVLPDPCWDGWPEPCRVRFRRLRLPPPPDASGLMPPPRRRRRPRGRPPRRWRPAAARGRRAAPRPTGRRASSTPAARDRRCAACGHDLLDPLVDRAGADEPVADHGVGLLADPPGPGPGPGPPPPGSPPVVEDDVAGGGQVEPGAAGLDRHHQRPGARRLLELLDQPVPLGAGQAAVVAGDVPVRLAGEVDGEALPQRAKWVKTSIRSPASNTASISSSRRASLPERPSSGPSSPST